LNDEIDDKFGFARVQEGATKEGWLINMHPVSLAGFRRKLFLTF
jgi:DNA polymerase epsilon subunit 1